MRVQKIAFSPVLFLFPFRFRVKEKWKCIKTLVELDQRKIAICQPRCCVLIDLLEI